MSWFEIENKNKTEANKSWFDVPTKPIDKRGGKDLDAWATIIRTIVESFFSAVLSVNDSLAKMIQNRQEKRLYQVLIHPLPFVGLPFIASAMDLINIDTFFLPSLGVAGFFTLAAWLRVYRHKEEGGTFGKASFAKPREVKKAGLVNSGLVFGRDDGKNLVTKPDEKDGHVMVLGGSGSGKTKSMALPSLINWTGAAICIDPKGELAQITAHLRPGKSHIFNPSLKDCAQYNPVSFCNTVEGAQELAQILLPSSGGDQFWNRSARGILAGALMEGYHKEQSLQQVCERVCSTDDEQLRDELINSKYDKVAIAASAARGAADKTLAGIMAELRSQLSVIAADDNIKRTMSRNDWTPENLEYGETIYLSIPEKMLNLRQYKAILNAIINQTISQLCDRDEGKNPPIMILIDELPRLGYIPQLVESIATLRSRNVHMVLIFQSFSQLDEHYGVNGRKTIVQNCDYKLILRCTEPETQQYLSNLAGQKTVKSTSTNKNEDEDQTRLNETGVPLIRPEEWGEPDRQPVLFTPLTKPILISRKAWYNEDPAIKEKVKPRPELVTQEPIEDAQTDEKQQAEVIPFPNEKNRSTGA